MAAIDPASVHEHLTRCTAGDQASGRRLMPAIYDELRRLAGHYLAGERGGHTLQPTALIHEAYLRLLRDRNASEAEQTRFKGLAAQAMRRVLVDHGRGKKRQKRGGDRVQVTLSGLASDDDAGALVDTIALHQALEKLAAENPRMAQVVEYGRIVYILIESTSTLTEMEASLRGTYEAAVTNVEIEAGVEYVKNLENVHVTATVYGGEMSIANLTGDFDDLRSALNDDQPIGLALPLSYNLVDLASGEPIRVKLATEYTVRRCEPLAIWNTDNLSFTIHYYDGFSCVSGGITSGPSLVPLPSSVLTGLPDTSGNGNHLGLSGWGTRPQVLPDDAVDGDVVQFRTVDATVGTGFPIPAANRRTYTTFSGTLLEDRDYTIFAVLAAPSQIMHRYWIGTNTVDNPLTNQPGYFMAGETLNDPGRNLTFGFASSSQVSLSHGGSALTGQSPSSTAGYQVYTARFSRENGMGIFVNGEKVSEDPALVGEIIALSGGKLGAAHPTLQSGKSQSFLRMRLVEVYGGAIGDQTIQEHATALRQQLGI